MGDGEQFVVEGLTQRINQLEAELARLREQDSIRIAEACKDKLVQYEQENHALRSRLTAVALVIRP